MKNLNDEIDEELVSRLPQKMRKPRAEEESKTIVYRSRKQQLRDYMRKRKK